MFVQPWFNISLMYLIMGIFAQTAGIRDAANKGLIVSETGTKQLICSSSEYNQLYPVDSTTFPHNSRSKSVFSFENEHCAATSVNYRDNWMSFGPSGGYVIDLQIDPQSPGVLYADDRYYVFWRDDRFDPTYKSIFGARVTTTGTEI